MIEAGNHGEHGVAVTDAKAARDRLAKTGGLEKQHAWGIAYLNERMTAMVVLLSVVVLISVWLFSTSALIRYGATAIFAVGGFILGSLSIRRQTRLEEIREQQLKDYQANDTIR